MRRAVLLTIHDLKTLLHRDLNQRDKLLLLLASFDIPCQVRCIKERAKEAGFRIPKPWNLSAALSRSQSLAIRTPNGWEITDEGKQHLRDLGVTKISPVALQKRF